MLKKNFKLTVFILLLSVMLFIGAGCGNGKEPAGVDPASTQAMQEPQELPEAGDQPVNNGDEDQTTPILLNIDKAEDGTHLGDVSELVPEDLPLPDDHEVYVGNATGYTKMENTLQIVFTFYTNEDEAAVVHMYETYIKGKGSFTISKATDPLIKMTATAINPYQLFDVTLQPREQGGYDVSISIAYSDF
ncbi:hypothetical protein [Paenibacillus thermotolerans]|uniref:hypothetical protein n=1 Tax=Paenibacillus thermotolerans TaxID=3027807 RepID=UPI002368A2E6|nr:MULTISPECIES: hypothetical protein [unclassified Paenibacillus]